MSTWIESLNLSSDAYSLVGLSLVIAVGLTLGSIPVLGIRIGVAGVLFSGIILSAFGLELDPHTLHFVSEMGLIFFVYTIGMQLGPGFLESLKKDGLKLNALAAAGVIGSVLIAAAISLITGTEKSIVVGILSGATTNTPSLGAAQETLRSLSLENKASLPGVGYAVAYPFGIMGILLTMMIVKILFRINIQNEAASYKQYREAGIEKPEARDIEVLNENLDKIHIKDLPFISGSSLVISRILSRGRVRTPSSRTSIHTGDILHAVGPAKELDQFEMMVGRKSAADILKLDRNILARRIVVTQSRVLGKSMAELGFREMYGVTFTRVIRSDIEMPITASLPLQYGDVLVAVGSASAVEKAAAAIGNAPKKLNHPHIIPVFLGILIGILFGSLPIAFPGLPVPLKIGLAGGPLIIAMILSRIGSIGPLVWYLSPSANFMMRELGITLFLACVGLRSGIPFVEAVQSGTGLIWMFYGAIITFVPIFTIALVARILWKTNFLTICGMISGSMTDPPALAFANGLASSNAQGVAYAAVYPLTMVIRILSVQILLLIL